MTEMKKNRCSAGRSSLRRKAQTNTEPIKHDDRYILEVNRLKTYYPIRADSCENRGICPGRGRGQFSHREEPRWGWWASRDAAKRQ